MKTGYEPGDQVRVILPFDRNGEKLVREGIVVRAVSDDRFRVVFYSGTDVDECEIEQAVVHQKHFL